MNAIDTNVLAYSVDQHDEAKRVRALTLIESLPYVDTIIPWQVACEIGSVLQTMSRRGRFKADFAETLTALRSAFAIRLPSAVVLDKALTLQRSHQLSYWDSLLIATCVDLGVTRLYSEDAQSAKAIEGVQIINPFA